MTENEQLFIVNRHTCVSKQLDLGEKLTMDVISRKKIASNGQIVELVSVRPSYRNYFGVKWREDEFKVLARAKVIVGGVEMIES
jgi:hypothetical protein